MATYRVSGVVSLDVSWGNDAEVRLEAKYRDYGIEVDGSSDFEEVLREGDTLLSTDFDIEVEADSKEEAEDLIAEELSNEDNWAIDSMIGGKNGMVSVTIDSIDVDVNNVELVDA